ncbi:MAG: molybdopterin molybdotransferase MoeA [Hyphomicrobiaceae bacterium]
MTGKLLDDCFLHDGERMRHAAALALLRERVGPTVSDEMVPLAKAAGRIAAGDVAAERNVPGHRNAAVDGYAFRATDYDAVIGSALAVGGRSAAGHPMTEPAKAGAAVRIFTGAMMPDGCDTVVMQEDVQRDRRDGQDVVIVPPGMKSGANVRQAGEDLKAGEAVLRVGQTVRPQDVAQLASIGLTEIACFKPLKAAIVSSGDEVVRAGRGPLRPGEVYDANAPLLHALVMAAGAEVTDLGVLPDDAATVRQALADAAGRFDVIITSGGASRGEEDHLVHALDELGKRHMWQLAVKPGRPMSFGQIGDCVVVGLPGNPVAVFVCALLYARPLLRRLGGGAWVEPRRYPLKAVFDFRGRKPGRREFWRGVLVDTPDGLGVDKFRRDGSGLISGLRVSDGLIDIAEERGDVRAGETVDFIPYTELGLPARG